MSTKHFFFRLTVLKKGSKEIIKLFPIANQTFDDGTEIKTDIYVPCSSDIKAKYIDGSIFKSNTIRLSSTGKSYCVSGLELINKKDSDILDEYNSLVTDEKLKLSKECSLLEEINSSKEMEAPSSTKDGFYMSNENWNLLVRNIKRNVNTMIIGPTGTGKTSCVKEVCSRLGIKLHIFDMGSMLDPISSLLGVHRLEEGHSIFDFAKFTQVIQEPCVILLDELNRASLSSNNILFPCLDDRRELSIEIAGSKDVRTIKVHPGVTFIATANIGSEYTGTIGMDKALVNRFFPLELGYIPKEEEKNVLIKRCGIDSSNAELIVKIANNIRSLFNKSEISSSVSIRESLMVANLISDGWSLGKAMEMVYLPLFEGSISEGERSMVHKTILSY